MSEVTSVPVEVSESLVITKQKHGGYVISEGVGVPGMYRESLYATNELADALAWIKWAMSGDNIARQKSASDAGSQT